MRVHTKYYLSAPKLYRNIDFLINVFKLKFTFYITTYNEIITPVTLMSIVLLSMIHANMLFE